MPFGSSGGSSPLTTKGDAYVFGSADARLPVGENDEVLTADSSEDLGVKWSAAGGAPGGADTQIQFNDGGSFGGDTTLTWNKTTDRMTVKSITVSDNIYLGSWQWNLTTFKATASNQGFECGVSAMYAFQADNNTGLGRSGTDALKLVTGGSTRLNITTSLITCNLKVNATLGLQTQLSTDDVSSPPTDAELDSAFGTPATVGTGFIGVVDDAGAGSAFYVCCSDGTNWWYSAMTKAV